MNAQRLINMLIRRFSGQAINAGINMTMGRGKDPSDMTPAEREQAGKAQNMAKQARKTMRATRRLTRL